MKILCLYKLLSYPDLLLVNHLEDVYKTGIDIFDKNRLFLEDRDFLKTILVGHDLGKATKYFQEYIKKIESHGFIKNHGFLSALITYTVLSKKFDIDKSIKGFLIVKRHHGNLPNIMEEFSIKSIESDKQLKIIENQLKSIDFNEVNLILDKFGLVNVYKEEIIDNFIELFKEMEAVDYIEDDLIKNTKEYFKLKYYYSILIYSDKFSLIIKEKKEKDKGIEAEKLNKFIKSLPGEESIINEKREKARLKVEYRVKQLNEKILTLTLPTGMGKTLNSLNFALKLREELYKKEGVYYNIIYSFPFTSIIDQTYEIFKDIFGEDSSCVLKHHYLSKVEYKDEEDYFETEKSKFLVETWDSNIVVTTFVKLLECIFTNRNSELLKFNKLANSIVILDEVQNIPHKYWKLINESFKTLSRILNIYFVLMTATQPLIFKDGCELVDNPDEYFRIFNRTKLNIKLKEKSMEDFLIEVEPIIKRAKKVMIVLNTVKSAQDVYKHLKDKTDKKTIFLSASIIPRDRKERLKMLKELDEYVLVSTQVVEAGVDIDNDIVIRDIGPWDSIVQCAGRCNRNNKKDMGDVCVYN